MRFARQGGVRTTCLQETREEVRYGDESENREPTSVPGKEGRTVQGGEASAAPCRGHASTAHVGPTTDGIRRTCSDSDPTSVERSPSTGAMSNRAFQLLQTTGGYPFLIALLFPFESNLHQPFI
jgi:hypothetical protein